ncbi:MAG: hypothetical protein Q7O66_05530, partial [Dehalococcoidia bacterium]|nr:hypothetical protein [Dehalococcoidia bacterium]
MNRIDELQNKYPEIPRDVILKHDVLVQGVRDGEDIDKASDWRRLLETYQSSDYDVTLSDLAERTPWRVKPGFMLRPSVMYFKSGMGANVRLRSASPYSIRETSEGRFALCQGDEQVEEIYFPRPKQRTAPEPTTSRGTPISNVIDFKRRCFWLVPTRYCQYFSMGDQCKFCNLNANHKEANAVGLGHATTLNLNETVEAYQLRAAEVPLIEGGFVMGGFLKAEQEAKIYLDFIGALAKAAPYKPNFTVHTQAMDRKDMQRLKDVGLDAFIIQIEVMDPQLFEEVCPGKAKHMPYERWLECFQDAVDIFGVGNAAGKLIPGITMLPSNGHKSWQEARDYHIQANNWLIKNGALPGFYAMWWAPGSVYEDRSYVEKFP